MSGTRTKPTDDYGVKRHGGEQAGHDNRSVSAITLKLKPLDEPSLLYSGLPFILSIHVTSNFLPPWKALRLVRPNISGYGGRSKTKVEGEIERLSAHVADVSRGVNVKYCS